MEIVLPPDLEKFVEAQVNSGKYASADAVVSASLQLLAQQEAMTQKEVSKTPLGKQLREIRQRAIAAGMTLVSAEAIAHDLHSQRDRYNDFYEDIS